MIQFTEKKEEFREKLLAEAKRLHLSEKDVRAMFVKGMQFFIFVLLFTFVHSVNRATPTTRLSYIIVGDILRTALKRKMMDSGFNLADFPDEDVSFVILFIFGSVGLIVYGAIRI